MKPIKTIFDLRWIEIHIQKHYAFPVWPFANLGGCQKSRAIRRGILSLVTVCDWSSNGIGVKVKITKLGLNPMQQLQD